MSPDSTLPSGSAPMTWIVGFCALRKWAAPEIVPPVPTLATKWVIRPSVCSQSSGPVVRSWAVGFSLFQYWSGLNAPGMSRASRAATRVVALGRLGRDVGRAQDDLGAVGPQQLLLLGRLLVGHDEDAAIALERRGDGQAVAGVARRRLDDRAARLEQARALGRLDHRQADPVLDRAAGVEHLELGEEQRLALERARGRG